MTQLTEAEMQTLAALADAIIPPSDAYGVPGAGDPAIVTEIMSDAGRRTAELQTILAAVETLATEQAGQPFPELDATARTGVAEAFRAAYPTEALYVGNLTAQCYYRDDRVVLSLGMELQPPHPTGYEVADGDWSLLEPVQKRSPFFRPTDS